MKKLYVIALILLSCSPAEILSATKSKKKSHKTTTKATETTTSQPAILAIEIVDPSENSTSAKHNKRTIDSSLGYGYNNFDSKPRYQVYKYSQHDIPPYKADANQLSKSPSNDQINVQKSVQYSLPTASQQVAASSNLLQPGTTLYSSLSDKGQVGSLSTNLPEVSSLEQSNVPVPVVVLRIYPHQLKDSTIQANLPKNNPYAKSINSLNIQSLLLQYIKTLKNPGILSQYSVSHESPGQNFGTSNQYSSNKGLFGKNHGPSSQYSSGSGSFGQNNGYSSQYSANQGSAGKYYGSNNQYSASQTQFGGNHGYSGQYYSNQGSLGHNTYSSSQDYQSPLSGPSTQTSYLTSNYYNQDSYQNDPKYQSNTGGAQNYMYYTQSFPYQSTPEYTRQNQYQQQQYQDNNSGVTVVEAPIKYEISPYQTGNQWRYETSSSEKPQGPKTISPTPQPEYYYVQPSTQNSYSTESSKYYLPAQQSEYTKPSVQTAELPQQQYYATNKDAQYSEYSQETGQQYKRKNQLLTFENYPTDKHTRVVFRTKTGDIRTPESEQAAPPIKEVKTIKIHVPDNVAKVEVEETERPYYAPERAYVEPKQRTKEPLADTYQPIEELEKEIPSDNYYLPPNAAQQYFNNDHSASEVFFNYQNVDDMATYFEKRGAMPKHFFQSPEDLEVVKDLTDLSTEANKDTIDTQDTTDLISTYEEAAFPSTISSPTKKKVKSKKRIPM